MSEPTTAAEALMAAAEASGVNISKGIQRDRHPDPEGLLLWALASAGWVLVEAGPSSMQSIRDGEALRLLREALPEGYRMRLHPTGSVWFVDVWRGPDEPDRSRHWIGLSGATIAEAADDCREALRGAGRPPQPGTGETTTPAAIAAPGPPSAPVAGCPACTDRERAP